MEQAEIKKAKWILGIFLLTHIIFIFWHPGYMWGIDFLSYYSGWEWIGIFMIGSVLFFCASYAEQILPIIATFTTGIRAICLILFVIIPFTVFKVPTHLLGDGALFLRELATLSDNQEWVRPNRSPIVYALIQTLYHSPHISSLLAYQIYSWTSGILYLVTACLFSKKMGRNRTEKALLLCILFSLGFIVQFFGYVENYALLFPAILTFLLLGLLTLEDKCHIFIFSAFTGVLVPIHFVTVAFIPSYCIVLYVSIIKSDTPKISTHFLKTAFCALLLLGVSALLFTVVNFDILSYLTNPKQSHLLAFNNTTASYSVFAPSHILDLINLILLLSPFACMVACFVLPKPKIRATPQNVFLMSATLFSWALICIANPEIGFFRDWDALSFGSLPLTIFLFYILRDQVTHPNTLARVGTLFIIGALFHALLWIGINAHREKSLNRYEAILKSGSVPSISAAFSWEAIGIYYRQQNQLPLAHNAYEQAAQSDPNNPRYLNAVGIFYYNKNDTLNALQYFRQAIVQNPKLAEVYLNVGNLFFKSSQYDSAKYYYEQAFNKGLKDAQVCNNLGITCKILGDEEQANKWFSLSEEKNR